MRDSFFRCRSSLNSRSKLIEHIFNDLAENRFCRRFLKFVIVWSIEVSIDNKWTASEFVSAQSTAFSVSRRFNAWRYLSDEMCSLKFWYTWSFHSSRFNHLAVDTFFFSKKKSHMKKMKSLLSTDEKRDMIVRWELSEKWELSEESSEILSERLNEMTTVFWSHEKISFSVREWDESFSKKDNEVTIRNTRLSTY